MQLDQRIAEITIGPKTKQAIKLELYKPQLKFKCQRCAVFCCKLGGPKLSPEDAERLRQEGVDLCTLLDLKQASLKSKKDGSCIFLSFNAKEGLHECTVYDHRPTLCRLYPFQLEKSGSQSFSLGLIPCCNGLNTDDGELIDAKFFAKFLQEILGELIESNAV